MASIANCNKLPEGTFVGNKGALKIEPTGAIFFQPRTVMTQRRAGNSSEKSPAFT
jgi:hypothetical protein